MPKAPAAVTPRPDRALTSDNISPVSAPIMAALIAANHSAAASYGADDHSDKLNRRAQDIFECDLTMVPLSTGTAANALALSTLVEPFECIVTQQSAHIVTDECGAIGFYSAGAPFMLLNGQAGKLYPAEIKQAVQQARSLGVHHTNPRVLSLSQVTEWGLVYSLDELRALCDCAHELGLWVHMDGARFANALVSLNVSPAEMSVKAGVDILSLGATKNGAMAAEAVIAFDPSLQQKLHYRRKRAGHLLSKMRYLAVQWLAYWQDDHWLHNARAANALAQQLAEAIAPRTDMHCLYPCAANELFVEYSPALAQHLRQHGFDFYDWPHPTDPTRALWRWVTRFDLPASIVTDLLECLNQYHA
jgi:threonine aldolase